MRFNFLQNDPSLESQWRAIILFGKNSATYKFAFGKALLELASTQKTDISISELAPIYVNNILQHLKNSDKQGNSSSSTFLNACRKHNVDEISYDALIAVTEKYGFNNVIDAFQNINGGEITNKFYEKDFSGSFKRIVITDDLLRLKESIQFQNFVHEVDSRWNLVETAWNLNLNPNLLEIKIDDELQTLYLETSFMKRKEITSARASLNGYQKGKCFYSFQDITIISGDENLAAVDHFLPHAFKVNLNNEGANVNGVWNLVLSDSDVNNNKRAKIPEIKYLERLYKRNEFYIESKHPLGETIVNQTGRTSDERRKFLQKQYELCLNLAIQKWSPKIELEPLF
ncbi:HNH endonuclease domain-containing protein [Kaistella antarctica]|uniref:HNH endonuclease n=1 Tax=Kaistella antarctica TaxID=266748 RepID=A0A3S4W559_9FLAO|nr:HNH endonuclease domain-containing protein [Kaistella antarctica]KEY17950.1 HNH endonuclease [Kaistella antarctica]SEV81554.1 HNH endonuclease [Kaistella antarctica]VEI00363.1 Uncharacterised protein [Kaistella antarctica]